MCVCMLFSLYVLFVNEITAVLYQILILVVHSNSPYPGTLGPGTTHNSEMPISGNTCTFSSICMIYIDYKRLIL